MSREAFLLDTKEFNTVLAALRFWQREGNHAGLPEWDVATNGGETKPLDFHALDDLCERLNT